MRSFYTKTLVMLSGMLSAAGVHAQSTHYYQPSLLPIPASTYDYPAVAMNRATDPAPRPAPTVTSHQPGYEYVPSPSDLHTMPQYDSYPSTVIGNGSGSYLGGGAMPGPYGVGGCDTGCGAGWYGNLGGLLMTRDRDAGRSFSYDTGDFSQCLLSNRDANMPWAGGFEARLGRYFNCNQNAVEMLYWGVFPGTREAHAFDPDGMPGSGNDLGSTLQFRTLDVDGTPVKHWFNQADYHRLRRDWEFHNVEANLLGGACGWNMPCYTCGPALRFNWLAGLRFMRFSEGFEFAARRGVHEHWPYDDEMRYNINVTNNLIGFQVGGRANYCLTDRFSLYGGTKLGVYGNHISHRSRIGTGDEVAVVNDPGQVNDGRAFNIRSHKRDVAFLGEIDFGANYQLTSHWSLYGGYRAVALTGVAVTVDQIPHDFADIGGAGRINSNSSLILHGGYGGVMFNY